MKTTPKTLTDSDTTLELLAEQAKVEIEKVSSGRVRLSKVVQTKTVNVPVTLTQEILSIEIHDVNAPDDSVDVHYPEIELVKPVIRVNGQVYDWQEHNGKLDIPLSQQSAKIHIETWVNEEVSLVKEEQTRTEQIAVELRHEELVVEEIDLLSKN